MSMFVCAALVQKLPDAAKSGELRKKHNSYADTC